MLEFVLGFALSFNGENGTLICAVESADECYPRCWILGSNMRIGNSFSDRTGVSDGQNKSFLKERISEIGDHHTRVPMPGTKPMVSSQAQHQDANGPHLGPTRCPAQKYSAPVVFINKKKNYQSRAETLRSGLNRAPTSYRSTVLLQRNSGKNDASTTEPSRKIKRVTVPYPSVLPEFF